MSTHKNIDKICWSILVFLLLLTGVLLWGKAAGLWQGTRVMGYENRLFDTSSVHTIEIVMDDWEGFLDTCENEEYVPCAVVIDQEPYKNVGIRAKGNTSLHNVSAMDSDRYSLKIEFDQYEKGNSYHGLDKLNLNNLIQDHTYMKDYMAYQMMASAGVNAPLCSYVYITVNGEDWGLYLAVEGVEESFLERNYGSRYGELYKPDNMDMGGGPGNGPEFDSEQNIPFMPGPDDQMRPVQTEESAGIFPDRENENPGRSEPFQEFSDGWRGPVTEDTDQGGENIPDQDGVNMPGAGRNGADMPGGPAGRNSDDVKLIYTDDDPDSYPNIFNNAKTDVTKTDQSRLIAALKKLNAMEDIPEVVDREEVIRYFVVHNFVCNFDSYTGSMIHNYYLYEEEGSLRMIPWDYNLAFGTFEAVSDATEMVNDPIDDPLSGDDLSSRPMLAWIFAEEVNTRLYHRIFSEWIADYFESGLFAETLEETAAMIAPYVEKDPTKFCTYEAFETGVSTLREFCLLRAKSVRGQLDGSIPATAEAQRQDENALIAADHLSLSDMGTMEMGMGDNRK